MRLQLCISNTNRADAFLHQRRVSPPVMFGVMPVSAISFYGNIKRGQEKVDAKAIYRMLTNVLKAESLKSKAHGFLQVVLASPELEATRAAKLSLRKVGINRINFAALQTSAVNFGLLGFGNATGNRADGARLEFGWPFGNRLAADTALNRFTQSLKLAITFPGATASRLSVDNRICEDAAAHFTRFFNSLVLRGLLALSRTEARRITLAKCLVVLIAALLADQFHLILTALNVAVMATVLRFVVRLSKWNGCAAMSTIRAGLVSHINLLSKIFLSVEGGARSLGYACQRVITPLKPTLNYTTFADAGGAA